MRLSESIAAICFLASIGMASCGVIPAESTSPESSQSSSASLPVKEVRVSTSRYTSPYSQSRYLGMLNTAAMERENEFGLRYSFVEADEDGYDLQFLMHPDSTDYIYEESLDLPKPVKEELAKLDYVAPVRQYFEKEDIEDRFIPMCCEMSGIGYSKELYDPSAASSIDAILSAAKEKGGRFVSCNVIAMSYLFDSPFTDIEECGKRNGDTLLWGDPSLESFYKALNKELAPSLDVHNEAWEEANIPSGDIALYELSQAIRNNIGFAEFPEIEVLGEKVAPRAWSYLWGASFSKDTKLLEEDIVALSKLLIESEKSASPLGSDGLPVLRSSWLESETLKPYLDIFEKQAILGFRHLGTAFAAAIELAFQISVYYKDEQPSFTAIFNNIFDKFG